MMPIISSRVSSCMSGRPSAHDTPELVVAMARAPACSITRALIASQALGSTRMPLAAVSCRRRKASARSCVVIIVMV
jgi:hypothetical protein